MGTDIHVAIERRVGTKLNHGVDVDQWRFVSPLKVDRNYILFGILAGVREHNITPISAPRGMPTDVDPMSTSDPDEVDCDFGDYGYSWLTLAELRSYDWETMLPGYRVPARSLCAEFHAWMMTQDGPPDDLRIVFGFDS